MDTFYRRQKARKNRRDFKEFTNSSPTELPTKILFNYQEMTKAQLVNHCKAYANALHELSRLISPKLYNKAD